MSALTSNVPRPPRTRRESYLRIYQAIEKHLLFMYKAVTNLRIRLVTLKGYGF